MRKHETRATDYQKYATLQHDMDTDDVWQTASLKHPNPAEGRTGCGPLHCGCSLLAGKVQADLRRLIAPDPMAASTGGGGSF